MATIKSGTIVLELTIREVQMLRTLLGDTSGTADEVTDIYEAVCSVCPERSAMFKVSGSPRVDEVVL